MIKTIFLDMDDTLNQFMAYMFRWFEISQPLPDRWVPKLSDLTPNLTEEEFWGRLDYDFWSTIPKSREFSWLLEWCVDLVEEENIVILTGLSLLNQGDCVKGKLAWLNRWIDPLIGHKVNYLIGNVKDVCAGSDKLLIDDSEINCKAFRKAGGPAILVPRPWNYNRGLNLVKLCEQFVP